MVGLILENIGWFIVLAFVWFIWFLEVDAQLKRERDRALKRQEDTDAKPDWMTLEEYSKVAVSPDNMKTFAFLFWMPSFFLMSGLAVGINWLVSLI